MVFKNKRCVEFLICIIKENQYPFLCDNKPFCSHAAPKHYCDEVFHFDTHEILYGYPLKRKPRETGLNENSVFMPKRILNSLDQSENLAQFLCFEKKTKQFNYKFTGLNNYNYWSYFMCKTVPFNMDLK